MSLELYYIPLGFPSRTVLLVAKALDVNLELKPVDLLAGEHLTEEFIKINPQHTVPTLVDGDLHLAESAAIIMYLAESYAKDDSLYPLDVKKRAVVNQLLFFNTGTLASRFAACYLAPVLWRASSPPEELIPGVDGAFTSLNVYLEGKDWVAGDEISIADYAIVSTVSTAEGIGYDLSSYENVVNWLARCKETMPDYEEIVQTGLNQFVDFYNEKLAEIGS